MNFNNFKPQSLFLAFAFSFTLGTVNAQDKPASSADELAKQMQNPIANLISLPFQNNFDFGAGAADGSRWTMNIQPVIPISISTDWNLISRTILPVVSQNDIFYSGSSETGLGDTTISAMFSPKKPTSGGIIWGAGPIFLVPTATDNLLGTQKFGVGPTAVALKQVGSFTVGALVNHIWSIAGNSDRSDVSSTFMQPFVAKNFSGGYALTAVTEVTQNWEANSTSGMFAIVGSKIVSLGKQKGQIGLGPKIFYGDGRVADYGFRAIFTLLFPK
jgi:hypothetical protein